jgi:hypothetical protein
MISHSLLEPHDPLAAPPVLFVFPHGPYTLLEDIVVADRGQTRRSLEMGKDLPELLRSAELEHGLY